MLARLVLVVTALFAVPLSAGAAEKENVPHPDWPVVFKDGFEADTAARYQPTDPKAWKIEKDGDNSVYSLAAASKYKPPVRSPRNYSLIKDLDLADFVLDARLKSTNKEYGHRDLCLFFGHQDPAHFYYVHIATKADAHAHSIFLVNGEPRVSIAKERTEGVKWGDGWHRVRLVREADTGKIEVYFDDMTKPIMVTTDKHFTHGKIGIGSFDDTGYFDDIVIRGKKHKP